MEDRVEGHGQRKAFQASGFFYFALILVALFVFRAVFGAGKEILNVDERELLASTLDRFTGTPSTALAWPAATVQMLLLPVAAVKIVLGGGFGEGLATLYSSPFKWTLLARGVLLLVGIGFASLAWRKLRESHNERGAMIGGALILASPIYLFQSYLVTGDAIGVWATVAAFAYLLYERRFDRAVGVCGLLLGFAIGSRVGFALYLPLVFVLGWMRRTERDSAWKLVKWFAIGLGAGFLMFMPFLWSDPIRLLKSVLGNAGRGGEGGYGTHLAQGVMQSGIVVWVVGAIAVGLGQGKNRTMGIVAFGYSLLMLLALSKLGVIYDRYFILVLPGLAAAVAFSVQSWDKELPKRVGTVLTGLFMAGGLGGIAMTLTGESDVRKEAEEFRAMVRSLSDEEPVYASKSVFYEMDYRLVEAESLRTIRDDQIFALRQSVAGEAAITHPMMRSLPWAFREDEQAYIGRLTAVLESGKTGSMNLALVETDEALAERTGIGMLKVEELADGAPVLLDVPVQSGSLELEKSGSYDGVKFYLYRVRR